MRRLLPDPVDPVDLLDVYGDPPTADGRPGLRLNMVASADGAIQTRIDRQAEDTIGFHPSPDGKRAIARSFPTASGYDLQTGKRLWHASGSDLWFAIFPDGEAFVSESTTLRLRSMATGLDLAPPFELRKRIPDIPLRVVLLPDGRTLLIADNEGLVFKFRVERP